jgi:hypothetical protein
MAFQIIRVAGMKKFDVAGIQIHDTRERGVSHTNADIDFERSHLNYDLHNPDGPINFTDAVNGRIASLDLKRALRKDANVMAQIFISASPDWFRQAGEQTQRQYFEDAYSWVYERYGAENVISATVHMDEATPHMHINFVPVTDQGAVCYADLFTERPHSKRGRMGGQLTALQDEFHEHNQTKGYDLERGERGSNTEHLTTLEFKVQKREEELRALEAQKIETMDSITELRSTALQTQGDVNALEDKKKRLQRQLDAAQGKLKGLEGKILTEDGINKISVTVTRPTFGGGDGKRDRVSLSLDDWASAKKTAIQGARNITQEKKNSSREKALDEREMAINQRETSVKNRETAVADSESGLEAQHKRADHWVTMARTYETNYNRVLKELNQLKGRDRKRGIDLD